MAAVPEAASEAAESAQRTMKRTYSSMWTGEDLDEDYGNSTQGPPKDRRAGANSSDHAHTPLGRAGIL